MMEERLAATNRRSAKGGGRSERSELPTRVELAVLVTVNLNVDLDIENGTRGEIVDIVLDQKSRPSRTMVWWS